MSITREYGNVVFQCDECNEFLETDESNFNVAKSIASREGWETVKDCEDWANLCPGCSNELAGK